MPEKNFNALMDQVSKKDDYYQGEVTSNWLQGRASFGGLVTSLGLRAMMKELQQPVPLRSLQVSFVGPVPASEVSIHTRILRQGRNVTQMQADIYHDKQVGCTILACFGATRESSVTLPAATIPDNIPAPSENLMTIPYMKGFTPEFTRQFEMRWAKGTPPFMGSTENSHGIWVRFREEGPANILHLVAIADTPPTPALSKMKKMAPASSLTWMLEIINDDFVANSHEWWYVETTLEQFSHGYGQQQYGIWAPDGTPVALGRQVVTVFG